MGHILSAPIVSKAVRRKGNKAFRIGGAEMQVMYFNVILVGFGMKMMDCGDFLGCLFLPRRNISRNHEYHDRIPSSLTPSNTTTRLHTRLKY